MLDPVPSFEGLNITFATTEECNLACKYCYEINKKPKTLSLEDAKAFIDIILTDPDPIGVIGTDMEWILNKGLILDFIGGDSLMNVKLVDEILKYFIFRVNQLNHKWANNWRASISTNGTLFEKKEVRAFVEKYSKVLSLGISIDGCPTIHDMNRIFLDGTGTMASIRKWLPWYRDLFMGNEFSISTKATCNRESIPYLFESLKYMHEDLGIIYINQNFIFENMHLEDSDLIELDKQLALCVDYLLENDDIYWSMLDKRWAEAKPMSEKDKEKNWCGSGVMPALAYGGDVYPCFRWLPHTQNKATMTVGNVREGKFNKKENFQAVTKGACRGSISPEKCMTCEIESACAYCIAGCYAEYNDFIRQTHICEVHKLQAKHSGIYYKRLITYKEGANDSRTVL